MTERLSNRLAKAAALDLAENHVWPAHLVRDKLSNNSPPVTYKNFLIVDSNVFENREEPPGNIRAFDALTGEFKMEISHHSFERPARV